MAHDTKRASKGSPRPGRPRSPVVDEAILAAAREELAERGYARMSVDAVAARERPHGMATIGTVLAEERETPELLALFRERLVWPRRHELRAVLADARERGELRRDADLDVAVAALVGAFFGRYLAGDPLGGRFVGTLVDTVLDGLRAC
jgi:AcrR family transcriptional regulator